MGKAALRAPRASPALAAIALCTAQEEENRLLCERQATAGEGCRGGPAPFHCWRDDDDTDGDSGATGQGGQMYELVIRYKLAS